MKKFYKSILMITAILGTHFMQSQDLVHYWNFNDNSSVAALTTPTLSFVSGASISASTTGISAIDAAGGTGQNFDIENLNAQNGDPSGTHLRFNDPIGGILEFSLPTTGYQNISVQFATRRSGSGADDQMWSYSVDGTTYSPLITVNPNNGNPTLITLPTNAITGSSDNPNFKLRVEFAQGAGGIAGNNRFDNFTLKGDPIGGDVTAPIVTFTPGNGTINIPTIVQATISFNEDVRLVDNAVITDANIDAAVELRLNNAAGAAVPFDATFSANTITVTPSAPLSGGQVYYLALVPGTIEDLSDNAVTTINTTVFTTVFDQATFAPADLAFVGYRMSATGAEDEVSFVALVDIPNGSNINFTDSKYTSNAQPQCTGGLIWTSQGCLPAGTVVNIQTNAMIASNGTLAGSGFGLSSNGDQVIVYTGNPEAPIYITALSSNGWVTDNTSCGGSLSMLPSGLFDGTSALNMSTAPGNVAGNSANGYYNGPQTGTYAFLRTAIHDPLNWLTSAASTAPQTWPVWIFPSAIQVVSATAVDGFSIEVSFSGDVDATSGVELEHYTGIDGLVSASVSGNLVTLNYSSPFLAGNSYTLTVAGVSGTDGLATICPFTYTFDGTLATQNFSRATSELVVYPNPSTNGTVNLNRSADISVYDYSGKLMLRGNQLSKINTSGFASGLYLIRTTEGATAKLLVR